MIFHSGHFMELGIQLSTLEHTRAKLAKQLMSQSSKTIFTESLPSVFDSVSMW